MAVGLKIINGDFYFTESGSVEVVSDTDKGIRDFDKMLKTDAEISTNLTTYYRYNPTYGNYLVCMTGAMGSKKNLLNSAKDLINKTIKNYLSLQESRNNLSLGEILVDISYDVYYDPNNPSTILIPMIITTAASTNSPTSITYEQVIS
jgi:hypothetical protein